MGLDWTEDMLSGLVAPTTFEKTEPISGLEMLTGENTNADGFHHGDLFRCRRGRLPVREFDFSFAARI